MVLCDRFANIYKPMKLSERGLLHVVEEIHKSASPPARREGECSFPSQSGDACGEKTNTHTFSQSHVPGLHCDLHRETQSCFTSPGGEICFVY